MTRRLDEEEEQDADDDDRKRRRSRHDVGEGNDTIDEGVRRGQQDGDAAMECSSDGRDDDDAIDDDQDGCSRRWEDGRDGDACAMRSAGKHDGDGVGRGIFVHLARPARAAVDATRRTEERRDTTLRTCGVQLDCGIWSCSPPFRWNTKPLHQPCSSKWEDNSRMFTVPRHSPSSSRWEAFSWQRQAVPRRTKPHPQPSTSTRQEGLHLSRGRARNGQPGECDDLHAILGTILLAFHLGVLAILEVTTSLVGHVNGTVNRMRRSDGRDGTRAQTTPRRGRRRPATRIRRWRIKRRPRPPPPPPREGQRARCRRLEARRAMYLAVSNHAIHVGSSGGLHEGEGCGAGGRCGGPMMSSDGNGRLGGLRDAGRGSGSLGNLTTGTTARCSPRHGTRWWTLSARIGEASNPGPLGVTVAVDGILRKVYSTARAVVSYPRPGTGSLRGAIAPGFPEVQPHDGEDGQFALSIEAVNATGWRGLQRRLANTEASVVLAQETWLTADALPAASAWARRKGWKSVWAAAVAGPNGGPSGGTAILVRDFLGLRYPPGGSHVWVEGRVAAAVLDAPGHRPMLLVSPYLAHGIGPGPANLDILATVGRRIQAVGAGYEVVIGGDMNMEPPDMATTGFHDQIGATLMLPQTCRGTFRTARAATLIDYFIVTNRAAAAVHKVATVEASGVKGHTPVTLTFRPLVTTIRALHLRKPPTISRERVHGPLPPPPDWTGPREAAEAALKAARDKDGQLQDVLDTAYRRWADMAELEMAAYAGEDPQKNR